MFMRDIDAPTNDNSYSGAALQLPGFRRDRGVRRGARLL